MIGKENQTLNQIREPWLKNYMKKQGTRKWKEEGENGAHIYKDGPFFLQFKNVEQDKHLNSYAVFVFHAKRW